MACGLSLKDQAGVDQRVKATGIMVDYSGQTSLCQDCSCSNRSQQILSDVHGPLALEVPALKANNGVTHSYPFPVGGHICSMFSCGHDLGSM